MTHKLKKNSGFTLIELIIYISILSIISVVVANSFLILNRGRAGLEAKSELNSNLLFAVEKIKRDVSSSVSATVVATTTLNLTTASSSVISYTLSNNQISRQVDSNSLEYITANVIKITNLNFAKTENTNAALNKKRTSIQVKISGSYNSSSSDWQYSQSEQTSADLNIN